MRSLLFLIGCAGACSPPPEQQTQYNFLNSALHDLDQQTPMNAAVLAIECRDYEGQARKYREIRAWRINAKVDRYVAGCSQLQKRGAADRYEQK
jgi:hypothetical protein